MKQTWTVDELRASLVAFDEYHGNYPEHEYEGLAIWRWLKRAVDVVVDEPNEYARQAWREYDQHTTTDGGQP